MSKLIAKSAPKLSAHDKNALVCSCGADDFEIWVDELVATRQYGKLRKPWGEGDHLEWETINVKDDDSEVVFIWGAQCRKCLQVYDAFGDPAPEEVDTISSAGRHWSDDRRPGQVELLDLVNRLIEWDAQQGCYEAPVWLDLRALRDQLQRS